MSKLHCKCGRLFEPLTAGQEICKECDSQAFDFWAELTEAAKIKSAARDQGIKRTFEKEENE